MVFYTEQQVLDYLERLWDDLPPEQSTQKERKEHYKMMILFQESDLIENLPGADYRVDSGRYEGKSLGDIYLSNPKYLGYLLGLPDKKKRLEDALSRFNDALAEHGREKIVPVIIPEPTVVPLTDEQKVVAQVMLPHIPITFGKYVNQTMTDVYIENPAYISYLVSRSDNEDASRFIESVKQADLPWPRVIKNNKRQKI